MRRTEYVLHVTSYLRSAYVLQMEQSSVLEDEKRIKKGEFEEKKRDGHSFMMFILKFSEFR